MGVDLRGVGPAHKEEREEMNRKRWMRHIAKAIRQSGGRHLRNDDSIATALDDLERGGYAVPDPRGASLGWGWSLTAKGGGAGG